MRVEASAFSDVRYVALARLAGLADADHARGKMLQLWRQCTDRETSVLSVEIVESVLTNDGVNALIKSELADRVDDGVRIRGTEGRIEWLQTCRENGKMGGRPRKKPRGNPKVKQTKNPSVSRGFESEEKEKEKESLSGSGSPVLSSPGLEASPDPDQGGGGDRAQVPTLVTRGGARDAGFRVPQPASTHHEATSLPSSAPGTFSRATLPPADGRATGRSGDPRADEQKRLLRVLSAAHVQVFNRVRSEVRAQVPAMQPVGDPAERALQELIAAQVTLEGFEDRARHVLAVAEAEAVRERSVKWLGASVWRPASFARAVAMEVGEGLGKQSAFDVIDQTVARIEREQGQHDPE